MLLVYALVGAALLSLVSYLYGRLIEPRHPHQQSPRRKEYPDMWIEGLLDCEYSPAKQAYGPARILPFNRVKVLPIARGYEEY